MAVIAEAPLVVAREGLQARLSLGRPVALISAPAGSGKTSLLRSWLDEVSDGARIAWVSVERNERDAQRFWLSVVEGLRSAAGDQLIEKLAPTPSFDAGAAVGRLVAELDSLDEPVVLVIDDLDELGSSTAREQLAALLWRRPNMLRIVLSTRHDPQLGLHRLRLDGQLTEIRASDLRFTLEEAHELLADSGVELPDESVAVLHARTEGWAAGLRLAALALATEPNPERFVAEFSGSERTVADYLLAEVLDRQPVEVRRLLLRTSILGRVNGALADLLTGDFGSEGVLHRLEQANAFVVALDAERSWFRYHSLFADLLRLELRRSESHLIRELHQTAADWYLEHGDALEAIGHAEVAENWEYATRVLAAHSFSLYLRGRGETIRGLLAALPVDRLADPELTLVSAYEPLLRGRLEDAGGQLAIAERNAALVPPSRRHRFDVELAAMRLAMARRLGDFGSVLNQQESLSRLLEAQTPDEAVLGNDARAVALMNLGIAELWSSYAPESERHLQEGLNLARRIDAPFVEVGCLAHLAVVTATRRSVELARELSLEAIKIAEAHGWPSEAIVAIALIVLAGSDIVGARFGEAERWLERAQKALPPNVDPAAEQVMNLMQGMLRTAAGRYEEALDAFEAAERVETLLVAPQRLRFDTQACIAQTLIRLGEIASADAKLAEVAEEDRDWAEFRVALASLHLARDDAEAAIETLDSVLDGAAPALRLTAPAQAWLLVALARERLNEPEAAESSIERALELAEPAGLVYPFIVTPVHALLERHPRHRTAHAALLSDILDVLAGSPLSAPAGERPGLREDLTEGELRVLRFLSSNLSAPEIGRELYLSTSTIKTHMQHIYGKLGVHRRTEAVKRARDLGLLAPSGLRR